MDELKQKNNVLNISFLVMQSMKDVQLKALYSAYKKGDKLKTFGYTIPDDVILK